MSTKFDAVFYEIMDRGFDASINEGLIADTLLKLKKMGIEINVNNKELASIAVVIGGLLSAITSGEMTKQYLDKHPELLRPDIKPIFQQVMSKLKN